MTGERKESLAVYPEHFDYAQYKFIEGFGMTGERKG
jgi:hypothetical protein